MKAVLISIKPKWCELIAEGKKTVEVRKTKPKIDVPFKCYIYCTKSKNEFLQSRSNMFFYCENKDFIGGHGAGVYQRLNGKVIGYFICDKIVEFENDCYEPAFAETADLSCVGIKGLYDYLGAKEKGYGWHISNLVIYDKPRELSEFKTECKEYYKDELCCEGCKYKHKEYCGLDIPPYFECKCDGLKPVERPPQSYQFVCELGV